MFLNSLARPVLIALLAVPAIRAQQSPIATPQSATNPVQVDVVVRDGSGGYPAGLGPEDFELRENGETRTITDVTYVSAARDTDSQSEEGRNIAIVIDDAGWRYQTYDEIPIAGLIREFADQRMAANDQLAVLVTSAGSGVLNQFQSRQAILDASGDDWENRFRTSGTRPDPPACWQFFFGAGGCGTSGDGVESFDAIRSAVDGLSTLPGRKIMVVISQFIDWQEMGDRRPQMLELTERANRAGIVLYVLDPADRQGIGVYVDTGIGGSARGWDLIDVGVRTSRGPVPNGDVLDGVSRATGGLALHSSVPDLSPGFPSNALSALFRDRLSAFLRDGLEEVDDDSSGYYRLSYGPVGPGPAGRQIEVRSRRKGLDVRTRSTYYETPTPAPAASPLTPAERLRLAMETPYEGDDLVFRMGLLADAAPPEAGTSERRPSLRLMLAFDPGDVILTPQPDGSRKAVLEVMAAAYAGDLDPAVTGSRTCSIEAPAGDLAGRRLLCSVDLLLEEPGNYVARAAVMDLHSGRIGSAFVAAPVWPRTHFDRRPQPPRWWRASKETVVPSLAVSLSPVELSDSPVATLTSAGNPVDQVFTPGSTLSYAFNMYRPASKRGRTPDLTYRLVLNSYSAFDFKIRGRQAQWTYDYLYDSGLLRVTASGDTAQIVASGTLDLPEDLEPGEYELEFSLYDLSKVSRKSAEADTFVNRREGQGTPVERTWGTAYLTVVAPDGAPPERLNDPMGYNRELVRKYPLPPTRFGPIQ